MEGGKGKDRESEPREPQPDKGKGPPAHFTRGETAHKVRKAGWGHREIPSKRTGWGAVGGLKGGHWGVAGRLQDLKLGTEAGLDWYHSIPKSNGGGVSRTPGSPAGTRLHRSLETNTTCSGGCVSSSIVSAPGQTHWGGPEGTRVWG